MEKRPLIADTADRPRAEGPPASNDVIRSELLQLDKTISTSSTLRGNESKAPCEVGNDSKQSQCIAEEIIVHAERLNTGFGMFGMAMAFPPLTEDTLQQLNKYNVNFSQEDFDILRERLNGTLFMRWNAVFGTTMLGLFYKAVTVFFLFVWLPSQFDFEVLYPMLWGYMIGAVLYMVLLTAKFLPMNEIRNFSYQSIRHTNTLVCAEHFLHLGTPYVRLIPFDLVSCQKHVSQLLHKCYLQAHPSVKIKDDLWEKEVNRFMCICLLHVLCKDFYIPPCLKKSSTGRHLFLQNRKCVCEIIEQSIDLTQMPLSVERKVIDVNAFSWPYSLLVPGASRFQAKARKKIVFRYGSNYVV